MAWLEGGNNGTLNGTTPATVVAAPGAATRRIVRSITIHNADTAQGTVHLYLLHAAATQTLMKVALDVGDTLFFDETLVMDAVDLSVVAVLLAAKTANDMIFTSSYGDAS